MCDLDAMLIVHLGDLQSGSRSLSLILTGCGYQRRLKEWEIELR